MTKYNKEKMKNRNFEKHKPHKTKLNGIQFTFVQRNNTTSDKNKRKAQMEQCVFED